MYKLLIVDDEEIERNALRMMIERYMPEIDIVAEAENGRIAIDLVEKHRPDFVTMDVKMPGINGIEAVKTLRQQNDRLQFIMVSAFDEFEYARQVMRFGVKEYLVKPCKQEHIISALQNVMTDIDYHKRINEQVELFEQTRHYTNLLMESEYVVHVLTDQIQAVNFSEREYLFDNRMKNGGFTMVLSLNDSTSKVENNIKQKIYVWLRNFLKEHYPCLVGPMVGNQMTIFVFAQDEVGEAKFSARSYSNQIARFVLSRYERVFQEDQIRIGMGKLYQLEQEFVQSYHEALISLQFNKNTKINLYEDLELIKPKVSEVYPKEIERNLLTAIKKGDLHESFMYFDQYLEHSLFTINYKLDFVKYDLNKLFSCIVQIASDNGLVLNSEFHFEMLNDVNSLKKHAKHKLQMIIEELNTWYAEDHKGTLLRAKQYIDENYSKDLSLVEVAENVQLNPYYFSKLFHDRTGVTFIDYITELRIEAAKLLLLEQKHSLKMISIQVGYRDPNYFSRVFKKVLGLSPSEYRMDVLKRKEMLYSSN